MTKSQSLMLRLDGLFALVDLKVWLLIWILVDLYRNTVLYGKAMGMSGGAARLMQDTWAAAGSPYILWIPVVVVLDLFVKQFIKSRLE